jgi:hypothetical protein
VRFTDFRLFYNLILLFFSCQANRSLKTFDDVDDDDDHDESDGQEKENSEYIGHKSSSSVIGISSTMKVSKHKLSTNYRRLSAKRSRIENAAPSTVIDNDGDTSESLSSVLNELNYSFGQLRKQVTGLTESCERHQKSLNLILHNQKKMSKAMRAHQVNKLYLISRFNFCF